ncbi:hypothetical protein LAA29_70038 [Leuconostoc carnosum]|nr:hypothetical protein LCAC16_80043 [Leuconostoc carnosum]SPO34223.1 hypothetical protein LAA29_70038 [Leuconostoc carnosum]
MIRKELNHVKDFLDLIFFDGVCALFVILLLYKNYRKLAL